LLSLHRGKGETVVGICVEPNGHTDITLGIRE
jgi:hypothetical protein